MSKPKLKYTVETLYCVYYSDFEEFVQKVYNIPGYSFVEIEEGNNDSQYRFEAIGQFNNQWDKERAERIRAGEIRLYENSVLFNCLVADGYLPEGTYLVNVSW